MTFQLLTDYQRDRREELKTGAKILSDHEIKAGFGRCHMSRDSSKSHGRNDRENFYQIENH